MATPFNIYATKLYSEHPIGIWALDDDVSYISLISESNRLLMTSNNASANWTLTNCSATNNPELPDIESPFDGNSVYGGIIGNVPSSSAMTIEVQSPNIFSFQDTNQNMASFALSFYIYQDSVYANSYEFGYKYYDQGLSQWVEFLEEVIAPPNKSWINFRKTFEIQNFNADNCYIVIKINVSDGGVAGDYNFILDAVSVGQWSEPYYSKSLGSQLFELPQSSSVSASGAIAYQYGLLEYSGYYIAENGKLLASNQGVPLIYGSESCVRIYPSSSANPSLIIPNKTMFSNNGRYKDFSLEFWMRIKPNTTHSRKIFGPLGSLDGIYVKDGFLTLKIGKLIGSYFVSNWYRPFIIHLIFKENVAILLINGEQVISLNINFETVDFINTEWFGFFSYQDIEVFEIDCISIFPYILPIQIAKKRFVWGQGVDTVENVNDAFGANNYVISFSNAGYNTNIIYPDKERWDAGNSINLVANTNSLSVPNYQLPTIYLSGRDVEEWYDDNDIVNNIEYPSGNHPRFFTFRPNTNEQKTQWTINGSNWTEQCYLNFQNMLFLSSTITSVYAIFEVETEVNETRPLITFINSINNKIFEITINGYNVSYIFDGQELENTGFTVDNTHFCVGFNIPDLENYFGYDISSFFGSPESIQVFIGGNGSQTFEGKIYRIGFSDEINYQEIANGFDEETGIALYNSDELFEGHYASYTISPFYRYNQFFLDVSVSSYWEEYFPLSYFASYINKRDLSEGYDVDYLQINFDYPSIVNLISSSVDNSNWNYEELLNEYYSPVKKSYEILDNLTGYEDYADLKENIITKYSISTAGSSVQVYATFQLLEEGANQPLSSFTYEKGLSDVPVIYADRESTNTDIYKAYKTKFQVIDGTIIYPPKMINFNSVALVLHFVIKQGGVISNPLKIRNLEITSKSLNESSLTPIGTKTGNVIYPYVKTGIYFSGKEKNPIILGKKNYPYLYLTENTGIKLLELDDIKEYGALMPINNSQNNEYVLAAAQMFIKYDILNPTLTPYKIFHIQHKNGGIDFMIEPDYSGQRYKIYARDSYTKTEYANIVFYQNGIEVENPYVVLNEWNIISFLFLEGLDMSDYVGSMNIFYGMTFQNIAFYDSTSLNEFTTLIEKQWNSILFDAAIDPSNNLTWQYWYNENGALASPNSWKSVLFSGEQKSFSITPKNIYQSFTGTNTFTIDDNGSITVADDDFIIFSETNWTRFTNKPV